MVASYLQYIYNKRRKGRRNDERRGKISLAAIDPLWWCDAACTKCWEDPTRVFSHDPWVRDIPVIRGPPGTMTYNIQLVNQTAKLFSDIWQIIAIYVGTYAVPMYRVRNREASHERLKNRSISTCQRRSTAVGIFKHNLHSIFLYEVFCTEYPRHNTRCKENPLSFWPEIYNQLFLHGQYINVRAEQSIHLWSKCLRYDKKRCVSPIVPSNRTHYFQNWNRVRFALVNTALQWSVVILSQPSNYSR